MATAWLKTRIFHRVKTGERVSVEGDFILLQYVRPLFERFQNDSCVERRFFRRYSEGGTHIDMRFLAERSVLEKHVQPIVKETLPLFLRSHFSEPPAELEYPPVGQRLYERLWGHEALHQPYTYDIVIADDDQILDPLLTPLQREFEDQSSAICIELLAALPSHQLRFQWAIVTCGMLLRESGLPLETLCVFCERMSTRWSELFEVDKEWEDVFEQRYAQIGDRLHKIVFADPTDPAVHAMFGTSASGLLLQLYQCYRDILARLSVEQRQHIDPIVMEIIGHNLFHMLHNRFNVSIQEELFSSYLLRRIMQKHVLLVDQEVDDSSR